MPYTKTQYRQLTTTITTPTPTHTEATTITTLVGGRTTTTTRLNTQRTMGHQNSLTEPITLTSVFDAFNRGFEAFTP